MRRIAGRVCCLAAVTVVQFVAIGRAQDPIGGGLGLQPTDAAFLKLFEPNDSFSATVRIKVEDKDPSKDISAGMKIAVRDGKVRTDMNMADFVSSQLPAAMLAQLGQSQMDKATFITIPSANTMYLIYPGLKMLLKLPIPRELAGQGTDGKRELNLDDSKSMGSSATNAASSAALLSKTELAKGEFDGHACVKNKVSIVSGGRTQTYVTWNAADLNGFPVQIQTLTDQGQRITMSYSQVALKKPDAALFEIPKDYESHDDQSALIQMLLQGMMQGDGGKGLEDQILQPSK